MFQMDSSIALTATIKPITPVQPVRPSDSNRMKLLRSLFVVIAQSLIFELLRFIFGEFVSSCGLRPQLKGSLCCTRLMSQTVLLAGEVLMQLC